MNDPTIEDRIVHAVETAVTATLARVEARLRDEHRRHRTHLSIAEAAVATGISERHCRSLVGAGVIPSVRLGERVVVPLRELERLGSTIRSE